MITGATGFAGGFLVETYVRLGFHVVGTFREPEDDRGQWPDGVELVRIDLRDAEATQELLLRSAPTVIHHLAAQSSVTVSLADPMLTLETNATMQYNILEGALALDRRPVVVVVGSCEEYGPVAVNQNPVDENQPLRPSTPYALSKVVQDLMGLQYFLTEGLHVIRARPFLQLGPRRNDTFVSGSFAKQVAMIEAGLQTPVIEVGNIDLQRDFTDVRDVALAFAALVDHGTPGDVYNIATGSAHTLREMLNWMLRISGIKAQIRVNADRRRKGEPDLLLGNSAKLRTATGWSPRISFEQSVRDTLDYWRDRVRTAAVVEGNIG